jgi:hypothetical protein
MSIGIGYNVHPSRIPAKIRISVNNKTLRAQIQDIGDFSFTIVPNGGNIAEDILSAVAWPIANIVAAALKNTVTDAIIGTRFDVMEIPDIPIRAADITVTLKPANMNLANYGGMLLIGCDLNIV